MAYASVVEGWHFLSPHVQDNPSFWQYSSITVLVNGKFTNHRSFSSSQYIFSLLPNITALISATFSAKYWWQISSFCVGCLLSTVVIIGHFSMLIIHLRSRFTFSLCSQKCQHHCYMATVQILVRTGNKLKAPYLSAVKYGKCRGKLSFHDLTSWDCERRNVWQFLV